MKKVFTAIFALAVLMLGACSDDDEKAEPKNQNLFTFPGDTLSMKGANLYLVYESPDGNGHITREYFVTNGTYRSGGGWNLSDYDDATYLLGLQIGVWKETKTLSPGEYPMYYTFSDAPETSNIAWLIFQTGADVYNSPYGVIAGEPIVLSGSFDDGDTMTLSYTGPLEYDGDETEADVTGSFYFTGKVQDVRVH